MSDTFGAIDQALARIAELEALSAPDAVQRHYMRGYNAANSKRHSYARTLEAERDRLAVEVGKIMAERGKWQREEARRRQQLEDARTENDALMAERDRLREALDEIAYPVTFMQQRAKRDGNKLSDMAYQIANSVAHLQGIARAALSDPSGE